MSGHPVERHRPTNLSPWDKAFEVAIGLSERRRTPDRRNDSVKQRCVGAEIALCALTDGVELPLSLLPADWPSDHWDWLGTSDVEVPTPALRSNATEMVQSLIALRRHGGDELRRALPGLDHRIEGAIEALSLFLHNAVLVASVEDCIRIIEADDLPDHFHPATFNQS